MYRENRRHLQKPLFSDLNVLPEKLRIQLEESWAGTFYRDVFARINEEPFQETSENLYAQALEQYANQIDVARLEWSSQHLKSMPVFESSDVAKSTMK
jgi:hypothetical protein